MSSDRNWLYVAVLARSLATGMIGVLLGIYLARLHLDAHQITLIVGIGLAGAASASLIVTVFGSRLGTRRALIALALLSVGGALALALSSRIWALAFAAFIGMVNGMGRDRGASLIIEQAALPSTTDDRSRTLVFAKYNVLQDVGHALGSLCASLPAVLEHIGVARGVAAFRGSIAIYALLSLLPAFAYFRLSPAIEAAHPPGAEPLTSRTRGILWRISSLFALDSLGGGFLTTALLAFFFYERFGVSAESIGLLFFGARLANAVSHFGAAWLARRIGLVNTMVFTHIPSSLLLATVPFMPNFTTAALLFLLREGLVEMDVPTRQSYVMAVVRPAERALASGITHLVRLGGWALAPLIASAFVDDDSLALSLYAGAAMKIIYDVLLWRSFRHVRPPQEQ